MGRGLLLWLIGIPIPHPGRLASRRAAWMILFQHGGQRSLAQPNLLDSTSGVTQ
jgi:hypothetical protein